MHAFYNPLPFRNQRNVFRLQSTDYINNHAIKFDYTPLLLTAQEMTIEHLYTNKKEQNMLPFHVIPTNGGGGSEEFSSFGRFCLYQLDSLDWDTLKTAFSLLYRELKSKNYDPTCVNLLIEHFIYHAQGINAFGESFFASADKLRDDEIQCLKERLEKPDGIEWLSNLCKRLHDDNDTSRRASITWLWKKKSEQNPGIRLFHFVSGPQAEKIITARQVPVGTFILRPSFNNPGHIAATFKVKGRIKHGIFEDPTVVRQKLKDDAELLWGLIAAPIPEFGKMHCAEKAEFFKEIDDALMFPGTPALRPPQRNAEYIRVFVGQYINQSGSQHSIEAREPSPHEKLEEDDRKRKTVHPGLCFAFGPALQSGKTHQENTFTIQTVNCMRENIKIGGCKFEIGIIGPSGRTHCLDHGDGTYTVSYYVERRGKSRISVRLMEQEGRNAPPYPDNHPGWEQHIKDSPFSVCVDPGKDAAAPDEMEWEETAVEEEIESEEGFKNLVRQQKAIYGTDARIEACDVDDEYIKHNIQCILSIWVKEDIEPRGAGFSQLKIRKFGRDYQLHPDEPFYDQPIGALGTAFLATSQIVITAGHCVSEKEGFALERLRFVTGYMESDAEVTETFIANDRIYFAVKLLYHKEEDGEDGVHDIAVLELDRPVKNAYLPPAVVSLSNRTGEESNRKITPGTEVYIIGHPCGLPMKVARHTKSIVTRVGETTFKARLDAFGGNSGSPVFNGNTHQVEGVLIGGNPDFIRVKGTYRAVVIPKGAGREAGETCYDIAYVRQILETIPQYQTARTNGYLDTLPQYQTQTYPTFIPARIEIRTRSFCMGTWTG